MTFAPKHVRLYVASWIGFPPHTTCPGPIPHLWKGVWCCAKSLKTLECGREKLTYVVRTTTLPHSLTTYRGIHGKLRLWSTNKTSFGGTRDGSRNHRGELCAKEAHGFGFRSEYHTLSTIVYIHIGTLRHRIISNTLFCLPNIYRYYNRHRVVRISLQQIA